MPKIVKDSKFTRVKCRACKAVMDLHESDIQPYSGRFDTKFGGCCRCPSCGHMMKFERLDYGSRLKVVD